MSSHILELLNISHKFIKQYLQPASMVTVEGKVYTAMDISNQIHNLKTDDSYPYGTEISIEHDGFIGKVIGHYVTLENKRGVVLQQIGTRIVHVYGEKWCNPIEPKDHIFSG